MNKELSGDCKKRNLFILFYWSNHNAVQKITFLTNMSVVGGGGLGAKPLSS